MINKGTIVIDLENVSLEQTERCRKIIHTLFTQGVLGVRNGKAILHFDSEGELMQIQFDVIKWKKDKAEIPLLKELQLRANIKTLSPLAQKELENILN